MTDDLKTRFSQYVNTVPEDQLGAIASYGLAVSFLKDATIARVCGVSNRNFAASISEASSLARHSEVRKRAIDIYRSAGSFDQANSMAKLIVMPLTSAFTEEEIKEVATAGFNNGQICYSHEFTRVLQALRSNPLVQKQWWDPFLQTLGANSSHPEAFFQAPTDQTDLTDAEPSRATVFFKEKWFSSCGAACTCVHRYWDRSLRSHGQNRKLPHYRLSRGIVAAVSGFEENLDNAVNHFKLLRVALGEERINPLADISWVFFPFQE